MWINLLVIFISLALGAYYIHSEKVVQIATKSGKKLTLILSGRKQYIILVCVMLILQSGLRNWAVGPDTYTYYDWFENVKTMSWKNIFNSFIEVYQLGEGKEPGYNLFQKIVQLVINDYQLYLILIAVIFFTALGYFIYKNTRYISDAMFAFVLYSTLFYSMFSITGIRQAITVAAALWGYELIKRKKLPPFLLLILLVSTIHKSVLIVIPLYFIRNKKAVKYLLVSFAVLLPFMFAYSDSISVFFQSIDDTYAAYEHMENLKPYNYVLLNLLIFVMGVMTYNVSLKQKTYPDTRFWYVALMLATFFTTQVFQIHGFMRVIYYFSIFNLLLIPHMFNLLAIKWKISPKQLMSWGIILLVLLYIRGAWGSEYKFFWQIMELGENYR